MAGLLALFCGITAWVPWVVVLAAPLAWAFALTALWAARKRDARKGLDAAAWGAGLALAALLFHMAVVGIFALIAALPAWLYTLL